MKSFVALVSWGKDSIYSTATLIKNGYKLICMANLYHQDYKEHDSYMYQSVGAEIIDYLTSVTSYPLYRGVIKGIPKNIDLDYQPDDNDEVEDLYNLLLQIMKLHPQIEAVCSGAIESTYQTNRLLNVCNRLNLELISPLKNLSQDILLQDMIHFGIEAIVIKTACAGLNDNFLSHKIDHNFYNTMKTLKESYGAHICGEGGEYESFVLYCPYLFNKRIEILDSSSSILVHDPFAPVSILTIKKIRLVDVN